MMKNKIALAMIGLASVVMLAACSSKQELATMKGGKITTEEFFDKVKTSQEVQSQFTNEVIYKVAELGFSDKVTKEDVQKIYDEQAEQYGDSFKDQLAAVNLDEASYKEQIKSSLAFKEMLESHVEIKDEDLKATWETYHPEVEVQLVSTSDEKVAKDILEKVKSAKKLKDLEKVAKDASTDEVQVVANEMKFDSTEPTVPAEIKEAAFKLKKDEATDVVTVSQMNQQTMQDMTTYYIVKMVKKTEKGDDMKKFEKEVKEIAMNTKLSDQAFVQKVISDELKKANVKILDETLKPALAGYIQEETEKSTESTEESSAKKDDKKDNKKEDKKETEKTDATK